MSDSIRVTEENSARFKQMLFKLLGGVEMNSDNSCVLTTNKEEVSIRVVLNLSQAMKCFGISCLSRAEVLVFKDLLLSLNVGDVEDTSECGGVNMFLISRELT